MYRWSVSGAKEVYLKPSGYDGPPTGIFREAGSNGAIVTLSGDLVIADSGNRGLAKIDLQTKRKTVLASAYGGKKFNSPNDLVEVREGPLRGAIYFTDPPYGLEGLDASPAKEMAFNGVYLLRPDGRVRLVDDTLTFPNGIAMAYDLGFDGLPNASEVFYDAAELLKAGGPGLPDGMKVDVDGRLFASGPGGLMILTPSAELLGVIETGGTVANCAFGDDGRMLYLTSNHILARVRTRTHGLTSRS
jgi:gluconolactonase